MAKQSFLLVSLKEDKARELAQVISNESCRKILDYLGEKEDATESELAKELGIPISTAHYNLQHLMKAGIVAVEEFHYSEKGKEVNHYKLANKYIVIAPKTTYGIKEKLRSILPVSLLALVGAGFIQIYTKYFSTAARVINAAPAGAIQTAEGGVEAPMMEAAVATKSAVAENVMGIATDEGARAAIGKAPEVVVNVSQSEANLALWFLFGCLFVIILIVVFELIRAKRENKRGQ